jgi:hypothetical protein
MRVLLADHDQRILQAMTAHGPLAVIVDGASDEDGGWRRFVEAFPGATLQQATAGWSSYRLPASTAGDLLPDLRGEAIAIKSLDAFPSPPHTPRALDGNLRTRWSGGVQQSAADFTIELIEPQRVGQLVVDLGEFWTDFPQRLLIEVSADGLAWQAVFDGPTALHAYYGALRHPKEIPLVFALDRDHVRFIRMKQLGWGTHDWSIAEVHVLR